MAGRVDGKVALVTGAGSGIGRVSEVNRLGVQYFDQRDREAVRRQSIRRLEHLGFTVTLTPIAAAA